MDATPANRPARVHVPPGDAATPESAVDERVFLDALAAAVGAIENADVFYLAIGGIASTLLGRPRWTWDIDVLVAPEDARRALDALIAAGFHAEETDERWLYKASLGEVPVDLIFQAAGVHLDDEMRRRGTMSEFKGVPIRVAAPEDLVVMKALAHKEEVPRYWHDALGIIAARELDWEYLVGRARHGPRRMLSLLAYAHSEDLIVPESAIRALFTASYGT
jgi:hypothetical protein